LAANKRPTRKSLGTGGDRPLIRSSHGAATPRPAARKKKRAELPGEARPAPRARREEGRDVKKARPLTERGTGPLSSRGAAGSPFRVPANVSTASDEAREIAIAIAVAAIEKKASGLEVIDVSGRVDYADFLVLMSGRSDRHVAALSGGIEEALRKKNKRPIAVEGLPHATWVLMDFGDVVVHVFQDDVRAAYDIDGLWMDARRVPVPLDPGGD
jgi:ribosome-associated protein